VDPVDEILSRTGKKVMRRELAWLGYFLLLILLSFVPYFTYARLWLLCFPVLIVPVVYVLAQKKNRQTADVIAALPDDAKEELKWRKVIIEKQNKKYLLIMACVVPLLCFGFILYGQHVLEKRERESKERMQIRIQQMQQRNAPGQK